MSVLEWKNLKFFSVVPCLDGTKNKLSCINAEITSYCCNATYLVFCDKQGYVHILRNYWEKTISFRASTKAIQKCAISKECSFLVLLIQADEMNDISLQVYDIFDLEISKGNSLNYVSCVQWNPQNYICCLQILVKDEILIITVGCEKGDLFFHRGLLSEMLSFRCFSISSKPIRNIEFNKNNAMFVCTDAEIYCYSPIENIYVGRKVVLDIKNSNLECCSAMQTTACGDPYFLIGRKNAVYCFTTDGRGPCYAVDGKKTCIIWYRNYLAMLISKESTSVMKTIIVIDIENKLITLQKNINGAFSLLTNGTDCYIISIKNELFILEECNLQKKVYLSVKKNLYDVAFRFIETQTCSDKIIADIYLKYGDYLMCKNKFQLAVQNYIKTIGFVNPYLIIRKLLNLRHNHILFQYLQALVESGHAQARHIQLLLKCNERQDLSSNIDTYFKDGIIFGSPKYFIVKSDKIKSRRVLLDFSFSSYLKIINDDKLSFEFVSNMDEPNIYKFLSENGKFLLTNFPQKTLKMLKQLYTSPLLINFPEHLIPLLLEYDLICKDFLEHIAGSTFFCNKSIYNLLFELYLQERTANKTTDQNIQEFLVHHSDHMCELHILLACKYYCFWPNPKYFCECSERRKFYMQFFPENLSSESENSGTREFSIVLKNKTKQKANGLFKFVGYILEEMIYSNRSVLEKAQNISKNKHFSIINTRNIFQQQELQKRNHRQNTETIIKNLIKKRWIADMLIRFLLSPIEFRTDLCSICRQEIHLPAVYFLCMHVFHKECLSMCLRKEICIICTNAALEITNFEPSDNQCNKSLIEKNIIIKQISDIFANGFMKHTYLQNYFKSYFEANNFYFKAKINVIDSPRRTHMSTNPFEENNAPRSYDWNPFEEYDANLNPFEAN